MGYGYMRYRGYRYRIQGPSKYQVLESRLGEMVGDLRDAFLQLEEAALESLLRDYAHIYNERASNYARKAYPKWKSGATRLSGQTMERLIELVPPYLSPKQRFDLLTKVLKKHKPSGSSRTVKVNIESPGEGFAELEGALVSMNHEVALSYLPAHVLETARWLNDDDVTVGRAMLAEVERLENDIVRESAAKEISLLRRTIESGQVKSAAYSVHMPAGTLTVVVFRPSFIASMFGALWPKK